MVGQARAYFLSVGVGLPALGPEEATFGLSATDCTGVITCRLWCRV